MMEALMLLAFGFVAVFCVSATMLAVRNWLSGPPSIRSMIRHINREQQKDLNALNEARLDQDEQQLARRAIKARYMKILHQLYFYDDNGS